MAYGVNSTQINLLSNFEETQYRPYKIAHQSVSLDVDIYNHCIKGSATIILIPLIQHLEYVTFDSKGLEITDVTIESRRSANYIYDDQQRTQHEVYLNSFNDNLLLKNNSVHQTEFYKERIGEFNFAPSEETRSQITIKIPSNIKITLQNTDLLSNYTPITPTIKGTPASQEAVYTPLTIKIDYNVDQPTSGLVFDTVSKTEPELWNVFTTNSELGCGGSNWMPCIDTLDEKCTWEIEISIPKTVHDLIKESRLSERLARNKFGSDDTNTLLSKAAQEEYDVEENLANEESENDNQNPLSREIMVVCSEYSTVKQLLHPTDISKKIFSFQIFNPISAQFIGWSVGAFDTWQLPQLSKKLDYDEDLDEIRKITENSNSGEDNIGIQVFTLPQSDVTETLIMNSCLILQRIMDFYSKEFGSFPFSSYSLLFLPCASQNTLDFAGFSIFNTRLLYPPEIIDQMLPTTEKLAIALANQWSGVNITPATLNDFWCCKGIAGYMLLRVIKSIFGNNMFHYKLKMNTTKIIEEDIGRPPLGNSFSQLSSRPISLRSSAFDFMELKSPMVLHILDRRMTKTERSFGMSRVLPKIFLQAMSGDLPNNALTSSHFQHVCEKVNKSKLESFFQQWVFGSGVPLFRVTQRYNKKRMVVEMGIRQYPNDTDEFNERDKSKMEDFFNKALNSLEAPNVNKTSIFTGSITIRIHDSDGTPYEHLVEIKDIYTKVDIQYNTKHKKTRTRKNNEEEKTNEIRYGTSGSDMSFLGNILDSDTECQDWGIVHPSTAVANLSGDEIQRANESTIEWIRIDSDFEWLSTFYLNQPDYMFATQLQRDSDIEAQLESVWYYGDNLRDNMASKIYASQLVRTLMDDRYFYGIRIQAAKALSRYICKPTDKEHFLLTAFKKLYCHDNSNIPKSNNFSSFQDYFLQMSFPSLIAEIKDHYGDTPDYIGDFLLDILSYNDNSENSYYDTYYLCEIFEFTVNCCNGGNRNHVTKLMEQIRRYEHLEYWSPSYNLALTSKLIEIKCRLHTKGILLFEPIDYEILTRLAGERWMGESLICYSNFGIAKDFHNKINPVRISTFGGDKVIHFREGTQDASLAAMKSLLVCCSLKNQDILQLFAMFLAFEKDAYLKEGFVHSFIFAMNTCITTMKNQDIIDDFKEICESCCPEDNIEQLSDEEELSTMRVVDDFAEERTEKRKRAFKSGIYGVLPWFIHQFESYLPLQEILWEVLHNPLITTYQRKVLFDIVNIMYTQEDEYKVTLSLPRAKKLTATTLEDHKVVIKRKGALRLHINTNAASYNKSSNAPTSNKIKLKTGSKPNISINTIKNSVVASKPAKKAKKPTINRVGLLPIRFVKISGENVELSSVPFSKNIEFLKVNKRTFQLKIKTKPKNQI